MADERIFFERDGVFIHTAPAGSEESHDSLLEGRLMLYRNSDGVFVNWTPHVADAPLRPQTSADHSDWDIVTTVGYHPRFQRDDESVTLHGRRPSRSKSSPAADQYKIHFDVQQLKSFRRSNPSLGWSHLIFILRDETTLPALHFHKGGSKALLQELSHHITVKRSVRDQRLFLVVDHDAAALEKSFNELQMFGDDPVTDILSRFSRPYSTTLGGFSFVTNLIRDAFDPTRARPKEVATIPVKKQTEAPMPGVVGFSAKEEPGFEVITCAEPSARPTDVSRSSPLSSTQWSQCFDRDGRVVDPVQVKKLIFRGGVADDIRQEAWKFLLEYYPWTSTAKSRVDIRKAKTEDYFRMKLQWKSISADQENKFSSFKEKKHLVEKDVTRTDRCHPFYEGEDNPNVQYLFDILMTYCMHNFDLGYVQGMSDLLSPIFFVMQDEVDAFWCFVGFMNHVHENFAMNQEGIKRQLSEVASLLQFLSPDFNHYLESSSADNMYFCFRWLLIVFKREFNFPDIMRLWEVVWTGLPCKNFHLLICVGILESQQETIMRQRLDFTEILKHVNELAFRINVEDSLNKAEAIFLQIQRCALIPACIAETLGLEHNEAQQDDSPPSSPDVS